MAAWHRVESEPKVLRRQAARAWEARWLTLLAVCTQDSIASTLVNVGTRLLDAPLSAEPLGVDVWLDGPRNWGPRSSRVAEDVERDAVVVGCTGTPLLGVPTICLDGVVSTDTSIWSSGRGICTGHARS